jgi:hypothetical protein
VFELARARLTELAEPRIDSMRWNGLRRVAADGTRLRVGTRLGHELRADHYAFALFLPGSELTLHAALHPHRGNADKPIRTQGNANTKSKQKEPIHRIIRQKKTNNPINQTKTKTQTTGFPCYTSNLAKP